LKINTYSYSYTDTWVSPYKKIEWKYNSTKWDNDSYIFVSL
jgi:hypothetical protein